MPISVAFVDDHPILLDGMVALCSGKSDLDIVARGASAVEALRITEKLRPDVIVLDLCVPGDTMGAVQLITRKYQNTRVIVLATASEMDVATRALGFGVSGFVQKGGTARDLYDAIRAVHAGQTFITPGFAPKIVLSAKVVETRRKAPMGTQLSAREEQIVRHLLKGSTNREIATGLDISEKTVKHYMTVLMQKLEVRNRVEVVLAAQKLKFLAEPLSWGQFN